MLFLSHSVIKKKKVKFISFHVASDWIGIEIPVVCVPTMKYHSSWLVWHWTAEGIASYSNNTVLKIKT